MAILLSETSQLDENSGPHISEEGDCALRFEQTANPSSEDAVVSEIHSAASSGLAIIPVGGRTALHEGNPPSTTRLLGLHAGALTGTMEFSPADMVITASAGVTLDALQAVLRDANQFLPIDVPHPDRTTVGGIVSTNRSGLWRPAFGTPRDRLLGLRAVLADGSVIKAGGKVVKNVAGYDLCKLYAGARGTLGVITEVTFKSNPLPDSMMMLVFESSSAERAIEAAVGLHQRMLQPAYVVATHPENLLFVGLMGNSETVGWQAVEIESVLDASGLNRIDPPIDETTLRLRTTVGASDLAVRLTVRPTETPRLAATLLGELHNMPVRVTIDVPCGIVDLQITPDDLNGLAMRSAIASISRLRPLDGHLFWRLVPHDCRSDVLDVWEPRPRGFPLMQRIKRMLDPTGMFSPGRFAGRL